MTNIDKEMDAIRQEVKQQTTEQIGYLTNKVRPMPHVFEVKHTNDRGVILELKPTNRLYFIILMGVPSKELSYPDAITKQFEGSQPHCGIGSYDADTDLKDAMALADDGKASWHTSPFGIPINRVIEEIIKMDYGMRVFGCFIP